MITVLVMKRPPKNIIEIDSYSALITYYVQKYFTLLGIEHKFVSIDIRKEKFKDISIKNGSHILGLGLRLFSYMPEAYKVLKLKGAGLITQVYETGRSEDNCDINFSFSQSNLGVKDIYINWGADEELCYPEKETFLNILIDHPHYDKSGIDISDNIAMMVDEFISNRYMITNVRRFISNGVEDLNIENKVNNTYNRKGLPYVEACKEYRKSDIFIVTHPESLGWSVIESAKAGNLVVVPKGYIKQDRLDTVRHYEFNNKIDWFSVINMLNVNRAIEKTKDLTWENIIKNILKVLK